MEQIYVGFNDEYKLVVDEIDAIATELGVSRAFVIREIICEAFNFQPAREMPLFKKHSKNV
jgi:hypothetical protein